MKSGIIKLLCKDCLSVAFGLILAVLAIISVTIMGVASQYWSKGSITDDEARLSDAQTEGLLKKKNMDIEELVRSGEIRLLEDQK